MSPLEAQSYAVKYAKVAEHMLEILGAKGNEQVQFGDAFKRAIQDLGLETPSEEVEKALLSFVFTTISGQRIQGAPDA